MAAAAHLPTEWGLMTSEFIERFAHATDALSERLVQARIAAEDAGGPSVDQLNGFANIQGVLAILEQLCALNKALRAHNETLVELIQLGNSRIEEAIHSQTKTLAEILQ